jgi:hypothetical protein
MVMLGMASPLLCHFVAGSLASHALRGSPLGEPFSDWTYLEFSLLWALVFTPGALAFYLWLPGSLATMLNALAPRVEAVRPLLLGSPTRAVRDELEHVGADFARIWNKKLWLYAAALAVLGHWLFLWFGVWPEERESLRPFWLESWWYRPFFILGYSTTLLILWLLVIKGALSAVLIAKWFRRFHIEVVPLHPDGVGGLAVVQRHAQRVLLFATFFGCLTWVYARRVWQIRSDGRLDPTVLDVLLRPDIAMMLFVYALAVPACALLPLLHAHLRMVDARNRAMSGISKEYNRVISSIVSEDVRGLEDLGSSTKRLTDLGEAYDALRSRYPVSPIRAPRLLLSFLMTYLPLANFVADMLARLPITRS